eukprot:jgi/Bigna1/80968/fgenesh1_pg.76_\
MASHGLSSSRSFRKFIVLLMSLASVRLLAPKNLRTKRRLAESLSGGNQDHQSLVSPPESSMSASSSQPVPLHGRFPTVPSLPLQTTRGVVETTAKPPSPTGRVLPQQSQNAMSREALLPSPNVAALNLEDFRRNMDRHGYHVIDNALRKSWCDQVSEELERLKPAMRPEKSYQRWCCCKVFLHEIQSGSSVSDLKLGTVAGTLQGIDSIDLVRNRTYQDISETALNGVEMLLGEREMSFCGFWQTVNHNGESKGQPLHFDVEENLGRGLAIYLCLSKDWSAMYDGQLRVHPFPFKPKDVAPRYNRMVIFDPTFLMSRLMPSSSPKEGWWLCMWLKGGQFRPPQNIPLPAELKQSLRFLYDARKRVYIMRVILLSEVATPYRCFLVYEVHKEESVRESIRGLSPRTMENVVRVFHQQAHRVEAAFPTDFLLLLKKHLPLNYFPGA